MNAEQLRARQKPLKDTYAVNPGMAMLTLKAEGRLADDLCCNVKTGQSQIDCGLHRAAGGGEDKISPVVLLLGSLAACFGVTLQAVSTHMGLAIREGRIRAEGDLDLRGTLGIDDSVPVGVQRVRLSVELDTDATDDQLKALFGVVKKYAVVYQSLQKSFSIEILWKNREQRNFVSG